MRAEPGSGPTSGGPARMRWYHRPFWVLVLLFVVLGPLGLPYLWRSPAFSRRAKIVLTLLEIGYVLLLADETIRVVRMLRRQMEELDTLPY